jgi:hypothetical protein
MESCVIEVNTNTWLIYTGIPMRFSASGGAWLFEWKYLQTRPLPPYGYIDFRVKQCSPGMKTIRLCTAFFVQQMKM